MAIKNEQLLITRAQQGDKEAFGDLYEAHLDNIYRYIFYRVQNHQDAEDLTETTFLKAWGGLPSYKIGSKPILAWLYRIAHNVVADHYHTQKEYVVFDEQIDIQEEIPHLEKQIVQKEQQEMLFASLTQLAPIHQHVLTLRFMMGLKNKEVADILEKNTGAVRVLQHRALNALHSILVAKEIAHV